ncbi:hypothetical protein [Nocardiopsis sp. TSRI0078]|uniref:hypothetical protein n=1 Tax=Nocardiopsis sp. TSRI0078 TaxID=1718951 RepID=UPI001F5BAF72|nr:hypothetical protein [Nocardiopsis sp. TSRI0078]
MWKHAPRSAAALRNDFWKHTDRGPRRTYDLPDDLAGELASFTEQLTSPTDLGAATRDKYRRSTAHFLDWLAQARQAGVLDGAPSPTRLRGTGQCATGAGT